MKKDTITSPVKAPLTPGKKALECEVVRGANVPCVKGMDDTQVAEVLTHLHDGGVNATKIIFDAGLYCFFLKDNLPAGQFGRWLQSNAPQRMWRLDEKGNPKASSSLSWQMAFTQKMVEACGSTIEKVLSQIPNTWEFGKTGKFLILSSGIPKPMLLLHNGVSERVEGKTAYQLFLEFKQADEDGIVKRGRLAGQGGATKAQRESAAMLAESEALAALIEEVQHINVRLAELADVKHLGQLHNILLSEHIDSCQMSAGFARRVLESRKGGQIES